jgi:hypothetical protein
MGWDFFDRNGNFTGSMRESDSGGSSGDPGCLGVLIGLVITFALYWLGHKYGNSYWSFGGVVVGLILTFTLMNFLGMFAAILILLFFAIVGSLIVVWLCSLVFPPICAIIAGIATFIAIIWKIFSD